MSKKVNFMALPYKNIEGKNAFLNVQEDLGNLLFMKAGDIKEHELGIKIYHADKETEYNDDEIEIIRRFAANYPYVVRNAIYEVL